MANMGCGCTRGRGKVPSGSANVRTAPSSGQNSDRSALVQYATPFGVASLVKPIRPQSNPGTNFSEAGTPLGPSRAHGLVREMAPIWVPHYFRNNIGVTVVQPMTGRTITTARPYLGQLPFASQPMLQKPAPETVRGKRAT